MIIVAAVFIVTLAGNALAHPLGNFTVNHFARIEVGAGRVQVRYVVDMVEIPAFQELQRADANGDGATSGAEIDAHLARIAAQYAGGLLLDVDGERIQLDLLTKRITMPPGAGDLPTLRVECAR